MSLIYYCLSQDGVSWYDNEDACQGSTCYGEINDIFEYYDIEPDSVNGIHLNLESYTDNDYYSDDYSDDYSDGRNFFWELSESEKAAAYRMYEEIAKPWVDKEYPGSVVYTDSPKGIFFSEELPFYYVVMITSFFRMKHSHHTAYEFYSYFRDKGYSPLVSLFCAMQANYENNLYGIDSNPFQYFKDTGRFIYGEVHEHMPWPSKVTKNQFKHLCQYQPGGLISMRDELDQTQGLEYRGRDTHFLGDGFSQPNTTHTFCTLLSKIIQFTHYSSYSCLEKADIFRLADLLTQWEKEANE